MAVVKVAVRIQLVRLELQILAEAAVAVAILEALLLALLAAQA